MTERPECPGQLASRVREDCLGCPGYPARKATEDSQDWTELKVTEALPERRARTAPLDLWELWDLLDPRDPEESGAEMVRQE